MSETPKKFFTIVKKSAAKTEEKAPARPKLYIVRDENEKPEPTSTTNPPGIKAKTMPPLVGMLRALADSLDAEVDTINKL